MGRINRNTSSAIEELSEDEAYQYQELPDYSRKVTLSDGTIAIFRDVTVSDIRELRKAGITDEVEVSVRLAARTCTAWGDKPGVTIPQIDKLRIKDFQIISQALESFLR